MLISFISEHNEKVFTKVFSSLPKFLIDERSHPTSLESCLIVLIALMLFLLPILPPSGGFGYEQIKVLAFLILTSIIGLIWIIISFKNPQKLRTRFSAIEISLGAFLLALLATILTGINLKSSFLGNPPYFQGFIVYIYGFTLFLFISTLPIKERFLAWIFSLSGVVVSLVALKDFIASSVFNLSIPNYAGRVVSTFGQPDLYSGFLLLSLPFTILLSKKASSFEKKILYVVLIFNLLGIVISGSRAALLLALGVLFVWAWVTFKDRIMRGILVSLVILLIGLGGYSLYTHDGVVYQEIINPLTQKRVGEEGQERRVYIWAFIVDLTRQRPIQGYGLDNLRFVFNQALSWQNPKPAFYFTVKDLVVDRSHNYILDLLVFGGIPTLVTWLIAIGLLWKKAGWPERFFLLLYLLWIQLQIQGIVHLAMFFVVAGLIQKRSGK